MAFKVFPPIFFSAVCACSGALMKWYLHGGGTEASSRVTPPCIIIAIIAAGASYRSEGDVTFSHGRISLRLSRELVSVSLSALCENKEKDDLIRWRMLSKKKKKKKRFRNILLNFFTGWPNFFQSFLFFQYSLHSQANCFGVWKRQKMTSTYISSTMNVRWLDYKRRQTIFCSVGLVQIDWLLTAVITGCSSHVRKSISPIFGGEGFFSPVWR